MAETFEALSNIDEFFFGYIDPDGYGLFTLESEKDVARKQREKCEERKLQREHTFLRKQHCNYKLCKNTQNLCVKINSEGKFWYCIDHSSACRGYYQKKPFYSKSKRSCFHCPCPFRERGAYYCRTCLDKPLVY